MATVKDTSLLRRYALAVAARGQDEHAMSEAHWQAARDRYNQICRELDGFVPMRYPDGRLRFSVVGASGCGMIDN